MPQRALLDGEVVKPFDVEKPIDGQLMCVAGEHKMSLVRQHMRMGETFVHRHFRKHPSESDQDCAASGGGESDIHERRKSVALSKALVKFDCSEWGLEKKIGDKIADAYVEFSDGHPRYGKGLAIEYQHKNKGKNKRAATENYYEQNYSTIWLWREQFNSSDDDVDLLGGRVCPIWPKCAPDKESWKPVLLRDIKSRWKSVYNSDLITSGAPATLPPEWCDQHAKKIWHQTQWKKIVSRKDELVPYTNGGNVIWQSENYIKEARDNYGDAEIEVKIPPTIIEPLVWRNTDWKQLFDPPNTQRYILQTAIPKLDNKDKNSVKLAPQICDEIRYRHSDWNSLFDSPKLANANKQPVEIKIDIARLLPREFWLNAFQKGKLGKLDKMEDLEHPPTPYDDVQCRFCGNYNYWKNAGRECKNCGAKYDWKWNVKTGRISAGSVPGSIDV